MLAALRPLPRRSWLPLLACGFLLGEAVPAAISLFGLALALGGFPAGRRSPGVGLAITLVGVGCIGGAVCVRAPWRGLAPSVAEVPLRYRGVVLESRARSSDFGPHEIALRLIDPPPESGLESGATMRVAVWAGDLRVEIGEQVELVARARRPGGFCNGGVDPQEAAAARRGVVAEASVGDARALSRLGVERRWCDPAHLARLWKARTEAQIRRALAPTEGAIVRALVLGDQRDIPPDIRRIFARTGTTHVLSVSGLHVAMVAMATLALTSLVAARIPWLGARVSVRAIGAVAAMPAVAGYAWLTSPGAPILRAAVMAELYLLALALRRRFHFPSAVALAAVLVGASDPQAPWDVSAQLSFVTLCWIWAGMRLLQRIWRERSGGWRPDRGGRSSRVAAALLAAVAVSALATLGAAPILAWHFGELSIIGLLANPIVVPLMGTGALGLGLTGMVLVPLVPAMSSAAFWLSGLCVWIAVEVARVLSAWPFAAVPVAWEPALTGSIAAAVATLPAPRARIRVARAAAGALLGTALMAVLSSSDPGLRVSFLDVGQGDAALVELGPKELRFLVDGGGLARGREPGERVLMPTLQRRGIARLDGGVVSHPEWDHFGGFETVTRAGKAAAIWRAEPRGGSPAWRRFEAALAERGVPVRVARPGRFLPIARSLGEVDVLHPTAPFEPASSNDASLVLRVRYGAASVLFTGDIEARAEAWLVTRGVALGASVVKVPHHGSATSSGQAFVRAVHPALAVASLGRGNAFRFPASTVVERYRRGGSEWLSTDRTGEVIVESDGQVIRLRRCRSEIRQSRADGARW